MQQLHRLPDATWGASQTVQIPLTGLPPGKRVRNITLHFTLSGTKDSADALDGFLWPLAITNIKIGNYRNLSGWSLWMLNHAIQGGIANDPTDIPGSGTTWSIYSALTVPFRDPRQPGSDDGSIPCELLQSLAIEISFAAANIYGVGNLVVTAGTVRAHPEIVSETAVPQLTEIVELTPGALSFVLDPGVYKELFIMDTASAGTITRAEVSQADLSVDGKRVLTNVLHEAIVAAYNASAIKDHAADMVQNAAYRLPLIWTDQSGKANLTKQPMIEKKGDVQLSGTITAATMRLVAWRSIAKTDATLEQIGNLTGAPMHQGAKYRPQTASKALPKMSATNAKKLSGMFKHLPGKFGNA